MEIKSTFGNRGVALRANHTDLLRVFQLHWTGEVKEIYFGPAGAAWKKAKKPSKSNRQSFVSLAKLRKLAEWLASRDRERRGPMIFANGTGVFDLGDLRPGDPDFIRKACARFGARYGADTTT
ncbi:MAG: hypothetical protein HQ527_02200 [Cyanobacteria bacterium]|nr:hypothetical protein [Cyanobacteria bacterium bin.51]